MHPSTRRRLLGISASGILLSLALSGCGGIDLIALKDSQIEELQYANARQRESLSKGLADIEKLEGDLASLEAERSALNAQLQDTQSNVRFANEQAKAISAERDEARAKIAQMEEARERLQESIDKVKAVASASAGELADLRLKRQEFEDRIQALTKQESSLREENSRLFQELEKAKEDLTRNRAVVRSLRGGEDSGSEGLKAAVEEIDRLEQENAKLKERSDELEKRLANVGTAEGTPTDTPAARQARRALGASYSGQRKDLERIASDFGALIRDRYQKALRGEIAWDTVDLLIGGTLLILVLLVTWGTIRWVRMRKVGHQLRVLNARVLELEQLQAEGISANAVLDGAEPPREPQRAEAAAGRGRRTPAMRRSGFSAVISTKDFVPAEEGQASAPADLDSELRALEDKDFDTPALTKGLAFAADATGPSKAARVASDVRPGRQPVGSTGQRAEAAPRMPQGSEPRKVIGARLWEEEQSSRDSLVDDLVSTQIIPKMSDDTPAKTPLPSVEPKDAGLRITPADELVQMAKSVAPAGPGSEKGKKQDDRDLLEELKAVVNKKFDELTK